MESESIDMCLTSPPYFRLRNYEADGQIGMELTAEQWAKSLHAIAQEIRRVLTPTGTLWLNLGDSYAAHPAQGASKKSLMLAPERVARLLIADGWILRNKIVWGKPNPMPSRSQDRLTAAHEVIYVFAKQPRYFFDLDAIRLPHLTKPGKPPLARTRRPNRPSWRGPNSSTVGGLATLSAQGRVGHPLGKNPTDLWIIPTVRGYGGHHAAFPKVLAERAILAGCPERRCTHCHAAWRRPIRKLGSTAVRLALQPTCAHSDAYEPGIVLDPFMGSGTTAVVAEKHQRDWLGIELNHKFALIADRRIKESRGSP
ncbi:site-specific DNA-methyltransferase [Arthrobacter sp. CJ23]|uniref:DNA-methyltransferase n=1 Tax=Arthrobacter sp. CJ23 TaxID=2972479 RepID=UPI00215D5A49|nr:site-specific DNA-methyltransferase [Arthrobacter sp. CJ23]UVJ38066.1 site-specific DNA-methyltransferase [Arthrobacter sp. CJ23]